MTEHAASLTPVLVAIVLGGDRTYRVQFAINGTVVGARALPRALGFALMAIADHLTVRARVFEAEKHFHQARMN